MSRSILEMTLTIRTYVSRRALAPLFLGFVVGGAAGCYVDPGPPPPAPPQAQAEVVVQGEPPPPPPVQVEVVPAPPSAEYYWVPGYHRWWGGRYLGPGALRAKTPPCRALGGCPLG